jgi:hypothetical protein
MIPKEVAVSFREAKAFPRWSPPVARFLSGLEEFRRVLRGRLN